MHLWVFFHPDKEIFWRESNENSLQKQEEIDHSDTAQSKSKRERKIINESEISQQIQRIYPGHEKHRKSAKLPWHHNV